MKRLSFCALLLCAMVSSAIAARLTVSVNYENSGSQGTYVCKLFKGGQLYAVQTVRNTGFTTGKAEFDVPKRDTYSVAVYCISNNTLRISEGRYFSILFHSLELRVQFS